MSSPCVEIPFVLKSVSDLENLVTHYNYDKQWRVLLDNTNTLVRISQKLGLPVFETFSELILHYDTMFVTARCTEHHEPNKCLLYFSEQGNDTGILWCHINGASNWVQCFKIALKYENHRAVVLLARVMDNKDFDKIQSSLSYTAGERGLYDELFDHYDSTQYLLGCCKTNNCAGATKILTRKDVNLVHSLKFSKKYKSRQVEQLILKRMYVEKRLNSNTKIVLSPKAKIFRPKVTF